MPAAGKSTKAKTKKKISESVKKTLAEKKMQRAVEQEIHDRLGFDLPDKNDVYDITGAKISRNGKPHGSKNKLPLKVREMLVDFLGEVLPDMMARIGELDIKEQWDVVGRILPYVTPKMISNDINGNLDIDTVGNQLSRLAEESVKFQGGGINGMGS